MYELDENTEKQEIIKKYRDLLKACKPNSSKEDKKIIRKAFLLAAEAHKDMRRKSGEPYLFHPLEVARIAVEEIGLGTTSVVCSLLHDVVEDTDYTLGEIEKMFGEKVAKIIDGLTKISGLFDKNSTSIQAENFRKMLLTLSDDVRVILIKFADRLHNMRTLDSMPVVKQLKISSETVYLYAPMAHRLGLYSIKSELEDLAFKYTESKIYKTIKQKLKDSEAERKRFINKFIYPIKKSLREQGVDFKIYGRVKSISSIWGKMKKKGIPFEEVYDLFAIRIIINTTLEMEKIDCWKVYSIVTDFYKPKHDRLRDWVSIPKANSYEALHTTVMSRTGKWVEIQIRTTRMNEIAEKGYAAHWKYKETSNNEGMLDEWLSKIRELLQSPESNALDFIDDFKLNLFADEIFVFTPKGELKTLPVNSTAIDFAFSIHSDIGNRSIGAKVNYNLVPLSYKLKSGDQIEIITSKNQNTKEEWVNFAITARAKSNIKSSLKEHRKEYTKKGEEILINLFEQISMDYNPEHVKGFSTYIEAKNKYDLYYKISKGKIDIETLKEYIASQKGNWFSNIKLPFSGKSRKSMKTLPDAIREQLKEKPEELILGETDDKIDYKLAQCCNPIPGDDVIGLITKQEGIIIHRMNCSKTIQFMSKYGNSIVKTVWTGKESIGFLTGLKINAFDEFGLIKKITSVISDDHNVNIRSFHIESSEGVSVGNIMLYVDDTKHLNELISNLKKIDGIKNVVRINRIKNLQEFN